MTSMRALARAWRGSREAQNITASVVRTAGRGAWLLFAPLVLPVEEFAVYSIFLATIYAASLLSALGAPQTIMREPQGRVPFLGFFLHSAGLALAMSLLIAWIATPPGDGAFFFLVLLGAIAANLQLFASARAKSIGRFALVVVSESVTASVFVLGIVGLGLRAASCPDPCVSYSSLALVQIVATVLGGLVLLLPTHARLSTTELRMRGIRPYLASVYTIGAIVVFDLFVWTRVELYFLEASPDGLVGAGVFGLSVQLGTLVLVPVASILETWYPVFASAYRRSTDEYRRLIDGRRILFLRGYAILTVASLAALPFGIILFFDRYEAWLWTIWTLVAIRLTTGYAGFHALALYATKRERQLVFPAALAAATALALNGLVTLRFGLSGALVSYAATHSVLSVMTVRAYRKSHSLSKAQGSSDAAST